MYWPFSPRPYNTLRLPPKFYIAIVSNFFWVSQSFQEKSKTTLLQNWGGGGGNKVYYGLGEDSEYNLYLAVRQVRVSITYSTQHGNINLKTTFVRYFLKIYIFNYLSLRNVHCLDKFHSSRKQTLTLSTC